MRFIVSRTSSGDYKPCKEAYEYELTNVDIRTVDDPKKLSFKNDRDGWFKIGTNHRMIDGKIARDIGKVDVWVIDINSIEDLVVFKKQYGPLILRTSYIDNQTIEIEIYDTYRS